jgi:hypothetical protein
VIVVEIGGLSWLWWIFLVVMCTCCDNADRTGPNAVLYAAPATAPAEGMAPMLPVSLPSATLCVCVCMCVMVLEKKE